MLVAKAFEEIIGAETDKLRIANVTAANPATIHFITSSLKKISA
jgi:hypothetical protein